MLVWNLKSCTVVNAELSRDISSKTAQFGVEYCTYIFDWKFAVSTIASYKGLSYCKIFRISDELTISVINVLRGQIELDPDLGKQILAHIQKSTERSFFSSLALFNFGLLLATSRLKRYEEELRKYIGI